MKDTNIYKKQSAHTSMSIEEKAPTIEGIFEVRRDRVIGKNSGGSWTRELQLAEGVIKGIAESKIEYDSANPPYHKGKKKEGVHITLENALGTATVEFPRRLIGERLLMGQRARYVKFHELYEECGSGCAGYTHKYTLHILTGPLAGEEIKEEIRS